jgi:predicted nucleotidyltransferase
MNLTENQRQRLTAICEHHGVERLAVFGSRARGAGRADSDLDLLIEFVSGRVPGFFGLAELAQTLSEVLRGLTVDLRTRRDLSRHFRDEVVQNADVLYAA